MNRTNKGANTNVGKIFADILALVLSYLVVIIVLIVEGRINEALGILPMVIIFSTVYLITNRAQSVYDITLFFYLDRIMKKITLSYSVAFAITFTEIILADSNKISNHAYYIFLFASLIFAYLSTFIYRKNNDRFDKRGIPRVVFAGKRGEYNRFDYFLQKTNISYELVGYVAYSDAECNDEYIGSLEHLDDLIRERQIDQVYIMDSRASISTDMVQKTIDLCIQMGVTARVIVNSYKRRRCNSYVSTVGTYPIVTFHTVTLNRSEEIIKRIFDIVFGLVGVILSSPIMLITAIAIKIDSPGPVLFKQTRVGKNGRLFKIYKFRSMCNDAEALKKKLEAQNELGDGKMFKMKDDPRVTRVGKFIRKTSIDELPQFFNIVGGSMSLVGTRPPTLDEVEQYDDNQWRRISIKPGLTGMWQVSGRSNITDFDEVVKLDTYYIDNWSVFMDIEILFKTVILVFKKDGAY